MDDDKKKKPVAQQGEQQPPDTQDESRALVPQGKKESLIPQDWLYNPLVYSQISGDFSLMQQRVLVGILEKLQDRVKKGISYKKQTNVWPSLFDDDELNDNIVMEIDPRSLGVIPANYSYLQEALDALSKIRVGYLKRGKTKDVYVTMPLFSRAEMPLYKNKSDSRRVGKIRVVMLKENVQDFFDLSMGYAIHMAKVAQLCQKKRTPRIYIFLSSCRDKGERVVEYDDFCKFLGIDEDTAKADLITRLDELVKLHEQEERDNVEKDKRRGITKKERNERLETWENPYRKFTKVKSLILEPSRKELDKLVSQGDIDFSFTYEPVYENDRKRGNPSKIHFQLIMGDLANDLEKERHRRDSNRTFINAMRKWCADFKADELAELLSRVPQKDADDFKDYCYREMREQSERRQPDNVAEYCYVLMNDWLKKRRAQRQREEQKEQLFAAQQEQERYRQQWLKCQQEIVAAAKTDEARNIFSSLVFEKYDVKARTLLVRLPSAQAYDYIESPSVLPHYLAFIRKYFHKDTGPQYRLPRE